MWRACSPSGNFTCSYRLSQVLLKGATQTTPVIPPPDGPVIPGEEREIAQYLPWLLS